MMKFAVIINGEFRVIETQTIMNLKSELGIDIFDCVEVRIGDEYFDIWCDDEGLFYDDRFVSAISTSGNHCVCGNIAIAKCANNGQTIGLSDDEIKMIKNYIIEPSFDTLVQYSGFGCQILKGRKLLCYNI